MNEESRKKMDEKRDAYVKNLMKEMDEHKERYTEMLESKHKLWRGRHLIESAENWMEWVDKIPNIKFDSNWLVRVIPPFAGVMARFKVLNPETGYHASIYLDCHERLGMWDGPYWEVYPDTPDGNDTFRCDMNEVDELLKAIRQSIND